MKKITKTLALYFATFTFSSYLGCATVNASSSFDFTDQPVQAVLQKAMEEKAILTTLENGFYNAAATHAENTSVYEDLVKNVLTNFEIIIERDSVALEPILSDFREVFNLGNNNQYDNLFKQLIIAIGLTGIPDAVSLNNSQLKEDDQYLIDMLKRLPLANELYEIQTDFWKKVNQLNLMDKVEPFNFSLPSKKVIPNSLKDVFNALWNFSNPKAIDSKIYFIKHLSTLLNDKVLYTSFDSYLIKKLNEENQILQKQLAEKNSLLNELNYIKLEVLKQKNENDILIEEKKALAAQIELVKQRFIQYAISVASTAFEQWKAKYNAVYKENVMLIEKYLELKRSKEVKK